MVYVLWYIRKYIPGATVVLRRPKDYGWIYIFTPTGVSVTDKVSALSGFLNVDDPKTFYLVDTIEPGPFRAKTIEVSSPCKVHYKQFKKGGNTRTYFMPIWSYEECLSLIHSEVYDKDKDDFFKHYDLIGGIPRLLFEYGLQTLKLGIASAIVQSDLSKCVRSIGE